MGAKDLGPNAALWLQGFGTTVSEIKNVVVVALIFLKHYVYVGQQ